MVQLNVTSSCSIWVHWPIMVIVFWIFVLDLLVLLILLCYNFTLYTFFVSIHKFWVLTNSIVLINFDWEFLNPGDWGKFDQPSNRQNCCTPEYTSEKVLSWNLSSLKNKEEPVWGTPLYDENEGKHGNEHSVGPESTEHVEVSSFDSSAVDLVEPLQEYKSIKYNSVMHLSIDSFKSVHSRDFKTRWGSVSFVSIFDLCWGTVMQVEHWLT